MDIVYVCDNNYLPYLKRSIYSIQRYNKNVNFIIISNQKLNLKFRYNVNFKNIIFNPDSSLFKFKQNDRMRDAVYYKIFIPELLKEYDKVLFLDCDVLCQRPLSSLWNMNCEYICVTESHSYGKKQAQELGLKKYALTGMMLMNLKKLREINFTNSCLDLLYELNKVPQHDETLINLFLKDKLTFIDKKYNYCRNRNYENPILESDAYILHFVGSNKKEMLSYLNFKQLDKLREKLKNKSIAIVGNSTSIFEQDNGQEIDNHDIVIRFNKGIPKIKECQGSKTNIVFLACTLNIKETVKYGNVVFVKRSNLTTNFCEYSVSSLDRLFLKQGENQPSTGFIAINWVLGSEYKQLDLYGFDFFKNPTYYNKPGYQTLHNGQKEAEKILEYQDNKLLNIK